jgi:hypothetical protein
VIRSPVDVERVFGEGCSQATRLGKLGLGERAVMLAFRAGEGDYRDWEEVEAWVRAIAGELRR